MFEILPHTADVAIRASGKNMEELLQALLQGMFAAAGPQWADDKTIERSFFISSSDTVALVVDFLSEALATSDINKEAYTEAKFFSLTDTSAKGILVGKPITSFETQIKAVTFHNLEIHRRPDGGLFETTVTFDV